MSSQSDAKRPHAHSVEEVGAPTRWYRRPHTPAAWTLIILFCLIYVTFTAAYLVSALTGNLNYPHYYISAAIDHPPAQMIGSLGFFVSGVFYLAMIVFRYLQTKTLLATISGASAPHAKDAANVEDAVAQSELNQLVPRKPAASSYSQSASSSASSRRSLVPSCAGIVTAVALAADDDRSNSAEHDAASAEKASSAAAPEREQSAARSNASAHRRRSSSSKSISESHASASGAEGSKRSNASRPATPVASLGTLNGATIINVNDGGGGDNDGGGDAVKSKSQSKRKALGHKRANSYTRVSSSPKRYSRQLERLNRWCLYLGITCTISYVAVASFPFHINEDAHNLAALLYFLTGTIWFILQTRITWLFLYLSRAAAPAAAASGNYGTSHAAEDDDADDAASLANARKFIDPVAQRRLAVFRSALLAAMVVLFLAFQVFNIGLGMHLIGSAAELVLTACWTVYYLSLWPVFSRLNVRLNVSFDPVPSHQKKSIS